MNAYSKRKGSISSKTTGYSRRKRPLRRVSIVCRSVCESVTNVPADRCNTLPNAIDRFQAMTPREQKDHLEYLHQRFDEPDPLSDLTHKLSAVGMAGDITLGPIIQPEELSRRQAKPTHTRGGKEKPRRSPAEGMSGTETVGQSSSMEGHSAAPEFEDKMEID